MAPLVGHTRTIALRRFVGMVVALVLVTGCASDDPESGTQDEGASALVPTFEPAPEAPEDARDTGAGEVDDAPSDEVGSDGAPDTAQTDDAPAVTAEEADEAAKRAAEDERAPEPTEQAAEDEATAPEVVRSSVTDPQGDTTSPLLGSAPEWADLVGGSVERTGTGEVTFALVLAAEPEPPREGTTMNVAAFHDLTGDGDIDLEVWANWSADGWFPSWRDNLEGGAAYGDDTGIEVRAEGPELHLVVPAERFGDTTSWRWSIGLEWGRYEWLGTDAAAHDLAPDEGHVDHGP
jgi:hypothetical protein